MIKLVEEDSKHLRGHNFWAILSMSIDGHIIHPGYSMGISFTQSSPQGIPFIASYLYITSYCFSRVREFFFQQVLRLWIGFIWLEAR